MFLSPDGIQYLRAARGEPVPSPFHRRWLIPRLLGPDPFRWRNLTRASLALTPIVAGLFFWQQGLRGRNLLFATALLSLLPGVWRCSMRFPVLLDAVSFASTLTVAALAIHHPWLAVIPALALGGIRETAPVFAALWSWSPVPLVGLLAAGWWRKAGPSPQGEETLPKLARIMIARRLAVGLDPTLYLVPFGGALVGLGHLTWQLVATMGAVVGQLLIAHDTIRLTAWVLPVLCLEAGRITPPSWMPALLLASLFLRDPQGHV